MMRILDDGEFDETVSRQRRWQRRKIREGRCIRCGKVRGEQRYYCDYHAQIVMDYNREARRKHNKSKKKYHSKWNPTAA